MKITVHLRCEDLPEDNPHRTMQLVGAELKPLVLELKPGQWYHFDAFLKAEGASSLLVVHPSLTDVDSSNSVDE